MGEMLDRAHTDVSQALKPLVKLLSFLRHIVQWVLIYPIGLFGKRPSKDVANAVFANTAMEHYFRTVAKPVRAKDAPTDA